MVGRALRTGTSASRRQVLLGVTLAVTTALTLAACGSGGSSHAGSPGRSSAVNGSDTTGTPRSTGGAASGSGHPVGTPVTLLGDGRTSPPVDVHSSLHDQGCRALDVGMVIAGYNDVVHEAAADGYPDVIRRAATESDDALDHDQNLIRFVTQIANKLLTFRNYVDAVASGEQPRTPASLRAAARRAGADLQWAAPLKVFTNPIGGVTQQLPFRQAVNLFLSAGTRNASRQFGQDFAPIKTYAARRCRG